MKFVIPETEAEALQQQEALASEINDSKEMSCNQIHTICGLDVAYHKNSDQLVAGAVVLSYPDLRIIESRIVHDKVSFPYISGLFSFREIPPLLKVIEQLETKIDVFVCDGQGRAHPRGLGLASHLGILLKQPTLGCGKTLLCGTYQPVDQVRGSYSDIIYNSMRVGRALRTQSDVKPGYVSVGHLCSLEFVSDFVLSLTPEYRLPETTCQADQLVNKTLKSLT